MIPGEQGVLQCPCMPGTRGCKALTAGHVQHPIAAVLPCLHAHSHVCRRLHSVTHITTRLKHARCQALQLPASAGPSEDPQCSAHSSFTDDSDGVKARGIKIAAGPSRRRQHAEETGANQTVEQGHPGSRGSSLQPNGTSHKTEVRIRVAHSSSIATTRAAHWALLQELVPKDEWKSTAVVLACLESIYRAEYLQYGQEALAALQRANTACVSVEDPLADISSSTLLPAWLKPKRQQDSSAQVAAAGSMTAGITASAAAEVRTESAYADGTSPPGSVQATTEVADAAQAVYTQPETAAGAQHQATQQDVPEFPSDRIGKTVKEWVTNGTSSSSSNSSSDGSPSLDGTDELEPLQRLAPETLQETAAQLDAELATLVSILLQRSHFEPLTLRDVEIAKALNRDWLLQLFIVGDIRRCDKSLVDAVNTASGTLAHATQNTPSLHGDSSDAELMLMRTATSPGSFEWAQPLPSESQDAAGAGTGAATAAVNGSQSSNAAAHVTAVEHQNVGGPPVPTKPSIQAFAESVRHGQQDTMNAASTVEGGEGDEAGQSVPDKLASAATTAAAATVSAVSSYVAQIADIDLDAAGADSGAGVGTGGGSSFKGISRHAGDGDGKTGATAVLKATRHPPPARSTAVSGISEAAWGTGVALPPESEGILLYKRGYGEVQSTGRLVVQKLDYLQTLLVTLVLDGIRDGAQSLSARLLNRVAESLSSMAEEEDSSSSSSNGSAHEDSGSSNSHGSAGMLMQPQKTGQATSIQSTRKAGTQAGDSIRAGMPSGDVHDDDASKDEAARQAGNVMHDSSIEAENVHRASMAGRRATRRPPPLRRGWLVRFVQQSKSSLQQQVAALTRDINLPKRVLSAGRLAARWFSERGVGPKLDVLTLRAIDAAYPVQEPSRLNPLFLRKIALAEVFGPYPFKQKLGSLAKLLAQPVKLQQPTLKEFVVVYRKKQHHQRPRLLTALQRIGSWLGILHAPPEQPPQPRPPVHIRIYRDLPLPTWQLALPDKLLQFRPLDLLRADLFALTGLVALLAQAKYESLVLDIITLVSAGVFLVRIALGFKRMDDRYRNQVAEVLREKTVASDGPALEYLAAASALQQFKQVSLAYIFALRQQELQQGSLQELQTSSQDGGAASLDLSDHEASVMLQGHNGANQANITTAGPAITNVSSRRPLADGVGQQQRLPSKQDCNGTSRSSEAANDAPVRATAVDLVKHDNGSRTVDLPGAAAGVRLEDLAEGVEWLLRHTCRQQVRFEAAEAVAELQRLGLAQVYTLSDTGNVQTGQSSSIRVGPLVSGLAENTDAACVQYRVVSLSSAMRLVQQHWDGLLWQRVDGILREFE